MKRFIPYLVMFLVMGLSACTERTTFSETTTRKKAALELYCKYADNANLTVAYVGNLSVNGNSIDALMLQANNEADWETLKQDFGFITYNASFDDYLNTDNAVMVGVGIETDFLDEAIFDTLTDIRQIPDKDIDRFTLIVADKMRTIMNSFHTPDSLLRHTAIAAGQSELGYETAVESDDDYVMAIARTLVVELINNRIEAKNGNTSTLQAPSGITNPAIRDDLQQQISWSDSIMGDAQSLGHIGYITAADNDERTLWLFFYDDQVECDTIINHINEDLIIK